MGAYINKGNAGFTGYTNGEYVDKTMMIAYINSTLNTANRLTCVTRPRRFGKSMAANMLCAYYDKSCDSSALFDRFAIAKDASYKEHLNKYPVIYVDVTNFTTKYQGHDDIIDILQTRVMADIRKAYPSVDYDDDSDLMDILCAISSHTGEKFIIIIDEWDALCRELADRPAIMNGYVNLLRRMFKSGDTPIVFAGVYMTGILPIKKYGTQSALNDFREYSMTNAGSLAPYFGFLPEEVRALCERRKMDFDMLRQWYDGYNLSKVDWRNDEAKPETIHIYNPNSVMHAFMFGQCDNYWARTESFESLRRYIDSDFDGVKETLQSLIDGKPVKISILSFGNDLNEIHSRDELFTLMVHLGYVSYNSADHTVSFPNLEVRMEIIEALRTSRRHKELSELIKASDRLLQATQDMDEQAVATAVEYVHNHKVAPNFYNNEQALRSVVRMAYLTAIDDYQDIQELPTGKGYADIVYLPRPQSSYPALVIELKWDEPVNTAIDQIRERDYPEVLRPFSDNILLVGVSYDKDTKRHTCKIEQVTKE
ncbi:MAG: ATP-binding protein [Bacteroidaceae bacterium]|nr:ATP-binding protein [Bacteroidaceae bacterium]